MTGASHISGDGSNRSRSAAALFQCVGLAEASPGREEPRPLGRTNGPSRLNLTAPARSSSGRRTLPAMTDPAEATDRFADHFPGVEEHADHEMVDA